MVVVELEEITGTESASYRVALPEDLPKQDRKVVRFVPEEEYLSVSAKLSTVTKELDLLGRDATTMVGLLKKFRTLSATELAYVFLSTTGKTDAWIASKLGTTEPNIRSKAVAVRKKLGVTTKFMMIAYLLTLTGSGENDLV